jgi:hypothetical protein
VNEKFFPLGLKCSGEAGGPTSSTGIRGAGSSISGTCSKGSRVQRESAIKI